jgi:hypothetical protein
MKTKLTTLVLLLIGFAIVAQQGINYKALIKDDLGNVVAGQPINIRFAIQKSNGTPIYEETHTSVMTDTNGVVIANIGEGTVTSGDFTTIEWSADIFQLQTEIDIEQDGTFETFDATPFKTVPYVKHAETAETAITATNVTVVPKPYILGRSNQSSSGRFAFNGKYGWQAAQEMCIASFPGDSNVRAFTLEQIAQAIVLGNWDTNNLSNIENFFFWGITPYAVGTTYTNETHRNNVWGLNHNPGDTSRGVRGKIIINANTIVGENPNGANPSNTYLEVDSNQAAGNVYPCMCGTYN